MVEHLWHSFDPSLSYLPTNDLLIWEIICDNSILMSNSNSHFHQGNVLSENFRTTKFLSTDGNISILRSSLVHADHFSFHNNICSSHQYRLQCSLRVIYWNRNCHYVLYSCIQNIDWRLFVWWLFYSWVLWNRISGLVLHNDSRQYGVHELYYRRFQSELWIVHVQDGCFAI